MRTQITICKSYRFEAAHWLPLVPDGHKCKKMHGHNYRVDIVIGGKLDKRGFIKDYAEIDQEMSRLLFLVDHQTLNKVPGLENPTAEIIARWFLRRVSNCIRCRVYENDDCWAEVVDA